MHTKTVESKAVASKISGSSHSQSFEEREKKGIQFNVFRLIGEYTTNA